VDAHTRPDDTVGDDVVVRIATFNARHGLGGHGRVSHRRLVDTCRTLDADVIALQEVDRRVIRSRLRDQPALIARKLAMRHVAAPAKRAPGGGSQCNALCVRGSFSDVEVIELPRTPGNERRVVVVARVTLAGGSISVACTHLQHRRGNAPEQLASALETLAARPSPRILAGDLNLDPAQVEPLLHQHGFVAALSGPTAPARAPRRRIDWIAVDRGLHVVGSRLHRPLVSDHLPVSADVAFRS
jgi:endonuclease/exonuclease/phosphatase family metal-dependent hydrolase